jgi:hypothetical protein
MHCVSAVVMLAVGWGSAGPSPRAAPDPAVAADEQTLRAANLKTDGLALLALFKERTPAAAAQAKLTALVALLGSRSYLTREKATVQLLQAGQTARPFLDQALADPDPEVTRRADLCLRKLADSPEPSRLSAAARLIARARPAGTAETLLAYLPFAPDSLVTAEVRKALAAVALRDGRPDPALVQALKDKQAVRRSAAGAALAGAGAGPAREARALLQDEEPQVRLSVALALTEAGEKQAVPVLIDLLPVLKDDPLFQAEELLYQIAGDDYPRQLAPESIKPERERDAWAAWWKAHEDKVDLAKLRQGPRLLGYTLIATTNGRGLNGEVMELGPDKKPRWHIGGLRYPVDARVIGPNRVLIAEYLSRCVTERDFDGKVVWTHQVDLPINCQRLPGGQTFIATRRQLLLVDRSGKEVFTYTHPETSITAAQMVPGGQMVLVSAAGVCHRLDAAGKELKRFPVGRVYNLGGSIDLLPGGRVLVPQYQDNKVVEYSPEGKVLWQAPVPWPTSAVRLPNGNTLVVSRNHASVVELSPAGQEVGRQVLEGRLWRARRR